MSSILAPFLLLTLHLEVYLQKYDEQGRKSLLVSHFCDAYKYYGERVIIVIELT